MYRLRESLTDHCFGPGKCRTVAAMRILGLYKATSGRLLLLSSYVILATGSLKYFILVWMVLSSARTLVFLVLSR